MDNKKDEKRIGKQAIQIKNNFAEIRDARKVLDKTELKNQCKCPHVDDRGSTSMYRSNVKSEVSGNPLFVCRLCGCYLDIGEITEEEMTSAFDITNRMMHIVKMGLKQSNSEKDAELLHDLASMQKFFLSRFVDLAKATRRKSRKNRNNGGGGNGSDGRYSAGRPVSRH